jgi:pimeloyl-ACP methyl ester carboxylesterase
MSHGFCLTSECWVFQRRYLRWAGYRVVVWDHRGHGRSDRGDVSSYTIAQLGEDLVRVIDAVAPEGPLVLVGHSMGGMTTMALGTLYPDLVRDRVVAFGAISTSAGGMPLASGRFAAAMGRLLIERLGPGVAGVFEHRPELLKNLLSANSELAEFFVERYSFASPVPRSVVKLAARMLLGTNLTVLSSFTPAFDNYDQTAGLVAFQGCETLVFNGEQDLVTPPEHSEAIVRALAGAQHVIVRDAGHVIMLEHPDLLNQQLDALIERAGRRAEEQQPADLSPRVRRVVTDVGKKRRIERGLERMDGQRRSAPGNRSTRERRREAS